MAEIRVLVVDDDFRVAALHAAMVEREPGFAVVGRASTAAEAVALGRRLQPDLVLLDVYLPDGSGLDVARELRAGGDIDVIMVTAARDADSVRTALGLGAQHYLIKPFGLAELSRRLAAFRELHRSTHRLPTQAEQHHVDELFARATSGTAAGGTPTGAAAAANPTLATVLSLVRDNDEGVSASEVAQAIGISRATAQRYLVQLEGRGEIVRALRYGTTGRPENRYRARPGGVPKPS